LRTVFQCGTIVFLYRHYILPSLQIICRARKTICSAEQITCGGELITGNAKKIIFEAQPIDCNYRQAILPA
jgi:hypothetical protein